MKKLLEEQRRRQQQPDAGGVPGQFPPPQSQLQPQPPPPPLIPSVNEVEPGHQDTVGSGLGNLAPVAGFPDWDSSMHTAYPDSAFSYPMCPAEATLTPDFHLSLDQGRSCPFSLGMEDSLDSTRLYAEPSIPQPASWRVSGLPPGPPPLPASTGPSLDTARAHMLALGPQQLLAQDEEGDT